MSLHDLGIFPCLRFYIFSSQKDIDPTSFPEYSNLKVGLVPSVDSLCPYRGPAEGQQLALALALIEVFCTLLSDLDHISSGRRSEGLVRCRLNLILFHCLAAEERYRNAVAAHASIVAPDFEILPGQTSPTLPSSCYSIGREILRLGVETAFSNEVEYNRRARLLYGTADFALRYGSVEEMSTNMVVVAVSGETTARQGEGRCLALMSIVHSRRKEDGRKNATVYGVCSDGVEFYFLRIDNDSKYSRIGTGLDWYWGKSSDIVSHIRNVIRLALEVTPTSTPTRP
ncbi:hypothetical protein I7I51_04207 [Histoplasma capsulatum]|uniref:Uncharacterized protein n=1 Tax=Ajellomyces capsulatus TaxID=5037 RepID=A0A8A1M9W1_AJECA|nr:hypothetical protein I7I51_04207 [Histoplasma capsulatum]